jgi:hypothetical protein
MSSNNNNYYAIFNQDGKASTPEMSQMSIIDAFERGRGLNE